MANPTLAQNAWAVAAVKRALDPDGRRWLQDEETACKAKFCMTDGSEGRRRPHRVNSDVIGQSRVFSSACTRSSSVLAVM